MNLRTETSLLGILTIETVLLIVYSSQPQRAFTSKSYLHNYRPLRFSRCSHVQQKVLLSSFSAPDNVLVTYVLTVKRRGCQIFSTLRSGGPLADGRQVGLDRAPDPGSGPQRAQPGRSIDMACGLWSICDIGCSPSRSAFCVYVLSPLSTSWQLTTNYLYLSVLPT
jgi:hypothetical protein